MKTKSGIILVLIIIVVSCFIYLLQPSALKQVGRYVGFKSDVLVRFVINLGYSLYPRDSDFLYAKYKLETGEYMTHQAHARELLNVLIESAPSDSVKLTCYIDRVEFFKDLQKYDKAIDDLNSAMILYRKMTSNDLASFHIPTLAQLTNELTHCIQLKNVQTFITPKGS